MKRVAFLCLAAFVLVLGIILFAKYVELGQIVFDGHGIGIYGWEVLNEEVPIYRNYILTASLALIAAAVTLLSFWIRAVRRRIR
jgi:hypothetical protein